MKQTTIKSILAAIAFGFYVSTSFAQAPAKMSYQAVIRDGSGVLLNNQQVGMKISVLQGSANGTAVYVETQSPTSNANGLVSIAFGTGTVALGTFASIDWANGPYFIKTETDPTGGVDYTITGVSELISVPYALHAKNGNSDGTQVGEMQYWNGSAWISIALGNEGTILSLVNGVPTWVEPGSGHQPEPASYPAGFVHCGTPTAIVNVVNPTTGRTWMDRNLGASQVATSSTDANAYGDLYQWGRFADGHQCKNSGTTTVLSPTDTPGNGNYIISPNTPNDWRSSQNNNLWQGDYGINNPCPIGYRLPTEAEFNSERLSWSSNKSAGAFASPLKLPLAGYRGGTGMYYQSDLVGMYWTSRLNGVNAYYVNINSTNAFSNSSSRSYAYSVRCIRTVD